MKNFTKPFLPSRGLAVIKKVTGTKNTAFYLLLFGLLVINSTRSYATSSTSFPYYDVYAVTGSNAPVGTATYCVGAPTSAYSCTDNETSCSNSYGSNTNSITWQWYYDAGIAISGATGSFTANGTGNTVNLAAGALPILPVGTHTLYCTFTPNQSNCGYYSYAAVAGTPLTITINPATGATLSGSTTLCQGSTTTLSSSSGGTWTSATPSVATITSPGGVVSGVSSGTSVITNYSTCGASTTTVTVIAAPSAISGATAVCVGSTITLSDPTGGGTWTSGTTTIATVNNTSGVVASVAAGTSVISYHTGCGSVTHSVTVNPLPSAITGTNIVCTGLTTSLSDVTAGGTWGSSNSSLATVSSGVVSGVAAGVPTITYTLPTGCVRTTTVIVNPPPAAIAGSSAVCIGLTTTLSDAAYIGTWSSSNTNTTISGTGVVTGVSTGTSIISFSNACGSATTLTVTVNPLPTAIIGPASVCVSYGVNLSDADPSGTWSASPASIGTANLTTGVITGVSGGTVTVTYTLPTSCIITTTMTVVAPAPVTGATRLCIGRVDTLAVATIGGTWSCSNTAIVAIDTSGVSGSTSYANITGIGLGTANITYTVGSGCSAIHTVTVTPIAPITGVDSICNGSTTYLAEVVGSGSWSSAVPSVASINSVNGFVTGVSIGQAPITYTTPFGCISTTTMNVIAIPPAITGTMKTCPGATTTLHDATTGGLWSTDNIGVATVNTSSGTFYGVFADTTSVNYTVRPGCTVSTQLTVNPLPDPITGNIVACETAHDTLHDATPGGSWSTTTPALATIVDTSGVATVLAGGNAIIAYTLLSTGCKVNDTILVHPSPAPVITYNWSTGSFYVDSIYASYQWYDSLEGLIPGATSPTLAALYTEYYYIVVVDTFGCIGTSALYEFNAALLGVKNPVNELINVYPNPANTTVYITSPFNVRAVVNSIDGKKVLEQANATEINITSLADGMYFITLYNDDKQVVAVRKLIKQ